MVNIVLVGPPRIGKTTMIKKVVSILGDGCAGFYTEEMKEQDERVGFKLVTLGKESCTLSHRDIRSHVHVGKYGVDLDCVDRIGVLAIKKGMKTGKVVIIDEIGKMEVLSRSFRFSVLDAFDSKSKVVATMPNKREPFFDKIKARQDVEVLEVTEANRDRLVDIVLEKLTQSPT